MGKISTRILKSSFSKKNINQYKLSILYGVDSLLYSISDNTKKTLALKKIDLYSSSPLSDVFLDASNLEEIWNTDSMLSLHFPTVHIAFIHPSFTIIPNRLYKESNKTEYLTPLKKEAVIPELCLVNDLEVIEAKLIFSLPKSVIDFFEPKYENRANYYNSFTPLIKGISAQMEYFAGKQVWVNVHPTTLQIILFNEKELIFSNQFSFESEKDFIYYVLLVYHQFKLDSEIIPLHISGQLVKESAIYKSLYRYIKNISFLKISDNYQLDTQLTESPAYFFFDLLSLHLT